MFSCIFTAIKFSFSAIAFLAMATMTVSATADEVDLWFGTTTPRNGISKGIYHAKFNTDSGKIGKVNLVAELSSPGFLAMHPSGKVLYAVGSQDGTPSVSAFEIDHQGKQTKLTLLNHVAIGDGGAAHVSVDRTGKALFTAQYGGGSTAMFDLEADGRIKSRRQLMKHKGGSKVVPKRQDKSHAHWTGTSPDNRFLFVPDLGLDQVVIWKIDLDEMSLTPNGSGVCPPGGGPRHMKFHPNGKYVYVLNELALSITVFRYDAETGKMEALQTIQTLSDDTKAKETFNSASEIRVHSSGRFVYSANRGNDSISAFRVDQNSGELSLVEVEPIRGGWPRNFNIDPTGKWVVAAGRDSNTATVFQINQDTGELTFVRQTAMVPSPICVLFE